MRVALFGGSFDPPHHGHIAIAAAAADVFDLDKVLFAPVGRQPLKPEGLRRSRTGSRWWSLRAGRTRALLSPTSTRPGVTGPNYTVETLATLHEAMPEARLFNLVGADSFLDLPRWHEPERLLELAEWIVVSRPGFPLANLSAGPDATSAGPRSSAADRP